MKFLVTGGTGFIGSRVVRNLLARNIPVVVADWNLDAEVVAHLTRDAGSTSLAFVSVDVSDFHEVMSIFRKQPAITHVIHLAYLMSAEVEDNPHLGVRVNVLGMSNLLEAALNHKLTRLVFTSSETVYGSSQQVYGDRPVIEDDHCSLSDHFFTYGVMKLLNEYMAEKYVKRHRVSIACTRPPVVFGHGRKRGSVLWAEQFASLPAVGESVVLPFSPESRDCWIYVDDGAEQLVRLSLKPQLAHFAYNSGGYCVRARELADLVRYYLPDAAIEFDATKPTTPLIDAMDGSRLAREIEFTPRPLRDGVRAHINEARAAAGLQLV